MAKKQPGLINRYPRALAEAYAREIRGHFKILHRDVVRLITSLLEREWPLRYQRQETKKRGHTEGIMEVFQRVREYVSEAFDAPWLQQLAEKFTALGMKAAQRGFGIELRRALRGRYEDNEVLLPRGRLSTIQEARILAQVQAIKSVADDYIVVVTRLIADAAANGVPWHDLADSLEDAAGLLDTRAELIARTELNRTYSESMFDRYDQLGVRHVFWVVTDDERTCEECAPLDGERMTVERAHDMLPRHPGCRCTVIADPDELREAAG